MSKHTIKNIAHRITLQSLDTMVGDGGRKVENFTTIATIWSAIVPTQTPPRHSGNKTEFSIGHEITVRYAPAYEAARRIIFGVRVFKVHSKINIGEKKQLLVFRCEEISTP